MKNFLNPKNWGIVKVYRDFENFNDWKHIIKREEKNSLSLYNKWKLERTKLYDIYVIVSLDELDDQLPEAVKRTKVVEMLNPLNRYLDEELGFAECLTCEFNQFEDDKGNLTLSYLIMYRFLFNKFSLKWIAKTFLILGIILYLLIHFKIIQWILHLI
jgi:hypothetical protein